MKIHIEFIYIVHKMLHKFPIKILFWLSINIEQKKSARLMWQWLLGAGPAHCVFGPYIYCVNKCATLSLAIEWLF